MSFDSSRALSHWLLEHECYVLCIRATVIRDGDICKIDTLEYVAILNCLSQYNTVVPCYGWWQLPIHDDLFPS